MSNFESPKTPLTLVPDADKEALKNVQSNIDELADLLSDARTKLNTLKESLPGNVNEAVEMGIREMTDTLAQLLKQEEVLKERLAHNQSDSDTDVGPWNAINSR